VKLAFCTEDLTDEVILLRLAERILGRPIEAHWRRYRFERGGWAKALKLAPIIARDVFRSDADGAIFAIDNDEGEPLHSREHAAKSVKGCRHCELVGKAGVEEVRSWFRPGLGPLKFFFVVPVRVLETWLLLSRNDEFPGDPLQYGRTAQQRRHLKHLLWKTEKPDQELMMTRGSELVAEADLTRLAQRSPSFHLFRDQLLAT
jgi:hypothetical protein